MRLSCWKTDNIAACLSGFLFGAASRIGNGVAALATVELVSIYVMIPKTEGVFTGLPGNDGAPDKAKLCFSSQCSSLKHVN